MTTYVIEVAGKIKNVEDFKISDIPEDLFRWELGGITDPLGQLSSFIIDSFNSVINELSQDIWNWLSSFSNDIINTLSGIIDSISQAISSLEGIVNDIANSVAGLGEQISEGLASIGDSINSIVTQIQGIVQGIVDSVQSIVSQLSDTIEGALQGVMDAINSIGQSISSVVTQISETISSLATEIVDSITGAIQSVIDAINSIGSSLSEFFSQISEAINSLANSISTTITEALQGLVNTVSSAINSIGQAISGIATQISEGFSGLAQAIGQIPEVISEFVGNVINTVSGAISGLQQFFGSVFNTIMQGVTEVQQTLAGFINPLVEIKNFFFTAFQDFINSVVDFFSKVTDNFVNFLTSIPQKFSDLVNAITNDLVGAISGVVQFFTDVKDQIVSFITTLPEKVGGLIDALGGIADWLKNNLSGLVDAIKGIGEGISKALSGIDFGSWLESVWNWISTNVPQAILGAFGTLVDLIKGAVEGMIDTVRGFFNFISDIIKGIIKETTNVASKFSEVIYQTLEGVLVTPIVSLSKGISSELREVLSKAIESGKGGEFEVFAVLIPSIASSLALNRIMVGFLLSLGKHIKWSHTFGLPGTNIEWTFYPGLLLCEVGSALSDVNKELIKAIAYGIAIWLSQPLSRAMHAIWRNWLPLEMPSVSELIRLVRRANVCVSYEKIYNMAKKYLAYYGYPDEVVRLTISPIEEFSPMEGMWGIIKDRFGRIVAIPVTLVHELPTPSEVCRMMVHDIFASVSDFQTMMRAVGYTEDMSLLFYMLHFKYPSLDKLWEFACRCVAGMAWVTGQPIQEGGLGYPGVAPVQLNVGATTAQQVKNALNNFINKYLIYYAKWHDYAPWAWVEGFTSDRLIMLDLMADIPQRIDARWMYKWGIISETELFKIVTARGMHPNWVELITVAEAMNALQEERTYARTGVINVFREGFADEQILNNTLSKLTTVRILGKDWDVKFLPGEVKLLSIRAKYDRAIDILRDYSRDLVRSYAENIVTWGNVVGDLTKTINKLVADLGIKLSLDQKYFNVYRFVADSLRSIYTVHRIRTWIRYLLYRVYERFSEGYISDSEIDDVINELASYGKFTPQEKELFKEIAETLKDTFVRRTKANAILKQLSRGAITKEQAKSKLMELGISEDVAEALIEEKAKTYVLSISTLLSYARDIQIPEDFLKKKLDLMGVPKEDQEIILQVFNVRPIKDEIAKLISALMKDFEEGYLTEQEFRKNLEQLGKRKEEIDILVNAVNFRKMKNISKMMVDSILNKLERGQITPDEAKKELKKYIKDDNVVEAMVAKSIKCYAFSVDKLVSMSEYVPVDIKKIQDRAVNLGYPKDEINMLPAYRLARNLNEEITSAVRELIMDYAKGKISKQELEKEIDNLRTLWGEVKKYGVDWIVVDDDEKKIWIQLAEWRRKRYEKSG